MAHDSNPQDLVGPNTTAILLWGLPILLLASGFLWPGGQDVLWIVGFLWIGGACLTNAIRCRRAHCILLGPLFMILGLISLMNTIGVLSIPWSYIGRAAGAGALFSFLPEFFGKMYFR